MKIVQAVTTTKYGDELFTLTVDGKRRVSAGGGEPEDNILARDLWFVFDIVTLMKEAHAAGVRGEPLEVVEMEAET